MSSDHPRVCVVIPVYNDCEHLLESLTSVIDNGNVVDEVIIIDDGSDEPQKSQIEKYAKLDRKIRLIRNELNLGIALSLNKAIKSSSAEFIARMDSDDICLPRRFELQGEFLANNPNYDVVGSQAISIDEHGNEVGFISMPETHEEIVNALPKLCPFVHPATMFRRSFFERAEGYNEKLRKKQDYELWARMASNSRYRNIQEPLIKYRLRDGQRRSFQTDWYGLRVRIMNGWRMKNLRCFYYGVAVFVVNQLRKFK